MASVRPEQPGAGQARTQAARETLQHAHLVGLGGIGVSAVAQWLKQLGWQVTGVDRAPSSVTDALARVGVTTEPEQTLAPPTTTLLVYTDAAPPDHPLRRDARARGIREVSYAEMLGELTRPYRTVAVSGSHGKSTTTALAGLLLEAAGRDPSVVIGTRVPQWERHGVGNYRPGASDVAVVEADEYGNHFLQLAPAVAVVTSVDYDHVDTFPTSEEYRAAFVSFLKRVQSGGTIVLCAEEPETLALRDPLKSDVRVVTYGVGEPGSRADIRSSEPTVVGGRQTFRVTVFGQDWGEFSLSVPGRHVVLDAMGALASALPFSVSQEDARRAFAAFQGTWRRFERVGALNGAPVISDYGHHPTELRALLAAARQGYPDRRIVIAFQPHHHTRTAAFPDAFLDALRGFDAVVLGEVYDVAGREDPTRKTSTKTWVDALRAEGRDVAYAATLDDLEQTLRRTIRPHDVVLVTGAGDVDVVARRLFATPKTSGASIHPVRHPQPSGIEEHVSLARYSTLHVGGDARYFVRVATLPELREALTWATERGVPWFVLGGGSNFFCRQEGFPGLVIKMENRAVEVDRGPSAMGHGELTADAGAITRLAVTQAVRQGLRGMERLAGIPGTIGGAVRGNAGAFGTETKDDLVRVHVLRATPAGWEEDILPREALTFDYRDSTFKRNPAQYVVWRATFRLETGDGAEGERLVADDLAARRAKQPYEFPSVGSVFKNPSPEQPAGKLIEEVGLKGWRIGGAEVSAKHANFIVNRGDATAADVAALIADIQRRVLETSGVSLVPEIFIL